VKVAVAERLAIAGASLVLAVILIALLSGYFAGRDAPTVSVIRAVGLRFPNQGDAILTAGYPAPPYDSNPPTSGAHAVRPIPSDGLALSDNQILTALAAGNVVVLYGSAAPAPGPPGLAALAGPFTPALAATGLAVVTGRRAGVSGLVAVAWTRMLRVRTTGDPLLALFIRQWLGSGGARG
jgi:hypothetical protein